MQDCLEPIMSGVQFLLDTCRQPDGSFEQPSTLQTVHTIYAVFIFQALRNCKLGSYLEEENIAIKWLLLHPDESLKVIEENTLELLKFLKKKRNRL
mgnify:CR=1 FL=1